LGVFFQESILDQEFCVIDNLKIAESLYYLNNKEQKEYLKQVIEMIEILDLLKQKLTIDGERLKIDINRAIINYP